MPKKSENVEKVDSSRFQSENPGIQLKMCRNWSENRVAEISLKTRNGVYWPEIPQTYLTLMIIDLKISKKHYRDPMVKTLWTIEKKPKIWILNLKNLKRKKNGFTHFWKNSALFWARIFLYENGGNWTVTFEFTQFLFCHYRASFVQI